MPAFNIFATGLPTEKFKTDLQNLFEFSDDQLSQIAKYLIDAKNPFPTSLTDLSSMADAVGVDAEHLNPALSLLRYVMTNWRRSRASDDHLKQELISLGYKGPKHKKALQFLLEVGKVKEKFFIVSARAIAEVSGLPTVDQLSLVWDIRPIFSSSDWSPYEAKVEDSSTDWLAHTTMLIFEIACSNREGQKKSLSVQMSEEEFEEFERLIGVARNQLDAIRLKSVI